MVPNSDFDDNDAPGGESGRAPAVSAQPSASLPLEPFRRLVAVHFECEEMGAALALKSKERALCEELCLTALAEAGVRSIPLVHEGQPVTVYHTSTLRTSKLPGVDSASAVQFFKDNDLGWLVSESYNSSRLAAFVREELAEKRPLPAQFESFFRVMEDPAVNVIKATHQESKSARAARNYRDVLSEGTRS